MVAGLANTIVGVPEGVGEADVIAADEAEADDDMLRIKRWHCENACTLAYTAQRRNPSVKEKGKLKMRRDYVGCLATKVPPIAQPCLVSMTACGYVVAG